MRTLVVLVLPALLLVPLAGCGRQPAPRPAVEQAADFGALPGLRATTDLALRDELARIEEEKGTPEQMMGAHVPPKGNIAVGLLEVFPANRAAQLLPQSTDLFPSAAFTFTPLALEKAVHFKNRYDRQRQQARSVLQRPTCDFGIRFTAGFGADLSFIEVVQLCARLEAFTAAECLSKSDVDGAVDAFRYMLRFASCLAAAKHVTPRIQGAYTRTEALTVLQAIVQHPKTRRKHLEQLSTTVRDLLAAWPDDADAWRGDRAIGLHAYELVRAGQADVLLTQEEANQFSEKGILTGFPDVTRRTVDADERFYLRTMRQIIESCRQPYYARLELFANIRNSLQERSNSTDYPIVAGRLLLTEFQQGHAVQAQDRANCEVWALALTLGAGQPCPPYQINPLTGQKYRILREQGRIEVANLCATKGGRPITVIVPDLSRSEPAR